MRATVRATSRLAATTWFRSRTGPLFVRVDGVRRDGTLADFEALLKLTQLTDALDTPGRNILEPNDVPLDVRHLVRALAAIHLTDRAWSGEPSSHVAAADCLPLAEIVFGGLDGPPVLFANCNVSAPLRHPDAGGTTRLHRGRARP